MSRPLPSSKGGYGFYSLGQASIQAWKKQEEFRWANNRECQLLPCEESFCWAPPGLPAPSLQMWLLRTLKWKRRCPKGWSPPQLYGNPLTTGVLRRAQQEPTRLESAPASPQLPCLPFSSMPKPCTMDQRPNSQKSLPMPPTTLSVRLENEAHWPVAQSPQDKSEIYISDSWRNWSIVGRMQESCLPNHVMYPLDGSICKKQARYHDKGWKSLHTQQSTFTD